MTTHQTTPIKFSPISGQAWTGPLADANDADLACQYRKRFPRYTWVHNPWTGDIRDTRDIETDPQGQLIIPPGEELESTHNVIRIEVKGSDDVMVLMRNLDIAAQQSGYERVGGGCGPGKQMYSVLRIRTGE